MPDFNLNSPNLMASNWCNSMMISLSRSVFDGIDPILDSLMIGMKKNNYYMYFLDDSAQQCVAS